MTRRKPPEGLTDQEHKRWANQHKNRNLHSCKFPDDLEEDYQAWKIWANISSDNQALRRLIATHPQIKNHG